MFILSLLSTVFPFVLKFLGTNSVEKVIAYKQAQMESATELKKAELNADIEMMKQENERKKMVRDLQLKEYEHPMMWWPKFILFFSICMYWSMKFTVKWVGLDDFGVEITPLDASEENVSLMILSYLTLENRVNSWIKK
jgi:hypothetical protein